MYRSHTKTLNEQTRDGSLHTHTDLTPSLMAALSAHVTQRCVSTNQVRISFICLLVSYLSGRNWHSNSKSKFI